MQQSSNATLQRSCPYWHMTSHIYVVGVIDLQRVEEYRSHLVIFCQQLFYQRLHYNQVAFCAHCVNKEDMVSVCKGQECDD